MHRSYISRLLARVSIALSIGLLLTSSVSAMAQDTAKDTAKDLGQTESSYDPIFKAMRDELARSMKDLKTPDYPPPYFIAYTIKQKERFNVSASMGAICSKDRNFDRTLKVELREGDYKLDSANATGYGALGGLLRGLESGGTSQAITADDDYDAIRHEIWLKTDKAYKRAIESLANKKAYLKNNPVKDMPDSFSKESPTRLIKAPAKLDVDQTEASETIRKLSATFKKYPDVIKSVVSFNAQADTRWFINSEGTQNLIPNVSCRISIIGAVLDKDGNTIADSETIFAESQKDLPPYAELEKKAEALASRLMALSKAPEADQYRGPVLFEGEAAAGFISGVLQGNLGHSAESLSKSGLNLGSFGKNPFTDKLETRILPKFISIIDDPLTDSFKGKKILTAYKVDEEGVEAQKITLVDKGFLKTFAMNRTPTKEIKNSNGHARGSAGVSSNLYLISEQSISKDNLKSKLIEMGREDGLKEVYIIRRLAGVGSSMFELKSMMSTVMSMFASGGEISLASPVIVYKVSCEDGSETLVRQAQFGKVNLRVLRDIEVTGDDTTAYQSDGLNMSLGEGSTVVTPSLLVREVEFLKPSDQSALPFILPNPLIDSK